MSTLRQRWVNWATVLRILIVAGLCFGVLFPLVWGQERATSSKKRSTESDRRTAPQSTTRAYPFRTSTPILPTGQRALTPPNTKTYIQASNHTTAGVTIEIEFGDLTWDTIEQMGRTVRRPVIDGTISTMDAGGPELPVLVQLLQLPGSDAKIQVLSVDEQEVEASNLARTPEDIKLDFQGQYRYPPRPDIYRNAYYPQDWITLGEPVLWRGHRLAALTVYPLRINPITGRGKLITHLVVRISFQGTRPNPIDSRPLTKTEQNTLTSMLGPLGGTIFARERDRQSPLVPTTSYTTNDYKIYVSEEGLYHITYQDLLDAGVPVLTIDPRYLRLQNKGDDIPIFVAGEADRSFDPTDYIEFYGIPNRETFIDQYPDMYDDPFTDINVYWLSFSYSGSPQGLRLIEESTDTNAVLLMRHNPFNFISTLHRESNQNFQRLSAGELRTLQDHWFFDKGISGLETRTYTVDLPYPDSIALDSTHIRIAMTGLTFSGGGRVGTHHAWVIINNLSSEALELGTNAGPPWTSQHWRNQTPLIVDTRDIAGGGISQRAIVHGTNTITIFCQGDTPDGPNDAVLLNWIEVYYPRLFRAVNNKLKFNAPADRHAIPIGTTPEIYPVDTVYHFRIDNFQTNDVSVYKLGYSVITNFYVDWIENPEAGINSYVVQFQDYITEHVEYLALTQSQKISPDSIRPNTTIGRLKNPAQGANYIAIAHPMFLRNDWLDSLMIHRASPPDNYDTMLVSTVEIYDEFNHGILSPYAIKDFIDYAYYNWVVPPEQVLLVGDLVYDMKNLTGHGGCWVPSIYENGSESGWYPSDYNFSLISGDDMFPDMGIGRFPCRNHWELNNTCRKVLRYEKESLYGPWRNNFLFISGEGDQLTNFVDATRQIMGALPDYVFTQHLEQDTGRIWSGGMLDLLEIFNQQEEAQVVSVYNGHGAGGTWAATLWLTSNIASMQNEYNLPFITNFTCYICAFDSREVPGDEELMGEEFLQRPYNGGVAVYGSVSLGWFQTGINYQRVLMPVISEVPGQRLGDIVSISKGLFWLTPLGTQSRSITTLHQMVLLGDPGVRLNMAEQVVPSQLSDNFLYGGDTTEYTVFLPDTLSPMVADFKMFTHIYSTPSGDALYPTQIDSLAPDSTLAGPWEKHLVFSDLPTDSFSVSVDLPDTTFSYLQPLGFPLASEGSVRGYMYRNDASFQQDAVTTARFYRRDAYENTVYFSQISWFSTEGQHVTPDTLLPDHYWWCQARVFYPSSIEVNHVWLECTVRDENNTIVTTDSLAMNTVLPDYFLQTSDSLGGFPESYDWTVQYQILAQYSDSLTAQTSIFTEPVIDDRADLTVGVGGSAITMTGIREVMLIDTVYNNGLSLVDSAVILYQFSGATGFISIRDTIRNVLPGRGVPVIFRESFLPGPHQVGIFLDTDDWVDETDELNGYIAYFDTDHFQVTPNRGTVLPGVSGTANVEMDEGAFSIRIPGGAISDSAVMVIQRVGNISIPNQAGISQAPGFDRGYQVFFGDSSTTLRQIEGDPAIVSMRGETVSPVIPDTLSALYRILPQHQYWTRLPNDSINFISPQVLDVVGEPTGLGTFAVLRTEDICPTCGPRIEISVEGQLFDTASYVPTRPKITAFLQDYNGIDCSPGNFWAAYGNVLSADTIFRGPDHPELIWTDTLNIEGQMGVTLYPDVFSEGNYFVGFHATDNNGNRTTVFVEFVVTGRFELLYVGNYPNPFSNRTLFTYTLTDQADERVRIKIYTVSGRLIRTLFDPLPHPINYREIIWDGRDENGNAVANGVYFAKIRAIKGDQVLEETLKVAKIR